MEQRKSSQIRRHSSDNRGNRIESSRRMSLGLDGIADGRSRTTRSSRSGRTLGSGSTHVRKSKSRNISIEEKSDGNNITHSRSSSNSFKRTDLRKSQSQRPSSSRSGRTSGSGSTHARKSKSRQLSIEEIPAGNNITHNSFSFKRTDLPKSKSRSSSSRNFGSRSCHDFGSRSSHDKRIEMGHISRNSRSRGSTRKSSQSSQRGPIRKASLSQKSCGSETSSRRSLERNKSSKGLDNKQSNHSSSRSHQNISDMKRSGHSISRRLLDDGHQKSSRRRNRKSLDERSSSSRNMIEPANQSSAWSPVVLDLELELGGESKDCDIPLLGMESRSCSKSVGSFASHSTDRSEDPASQVDLTSVKPSLNKLSFRSSGNCNSTSSGRKRSIGSHSYRSKKSTQDERMSVDEAFLMYTRVEAAALQIQKVFRRRHPELVPNKEDSSNHSDSSGAFFSKPSPPPLTTEEEEDKSRFYGLICLSVAAVIRLIAYLFCGWSDLLGMDSNSNDAIAAANLAKGTTGGGGAGAEQGPMQAMAGQAASAAGSAASSGVAAAGAAGAAAAGAAAAGGLAGAVATGVGVSAAVATVAGIAVVATGGNITTVVPSEAAIVSSCGLVDPTIRAARVSFWMEGFTNEFDLREAGILESLLVESYNDIIMGNGCSDKYLRELNYAKLVNQTVYPANEFNNSIVETIFDTTLFCDGCPTYNPMFADLDGAGGVLRRNLWEVEPQMRYLAESLDGSLKSFQNFITNFMVEVKQLSDDKEIGSGFIQMVLGVITEIDEDEDENGSSSSGNQGFGGSGPSMVTDINASFNDVGELSTITFTFKVNGEEIISTVSVAPPTGAPTVTPTQRPTDVPSYIPTLSQRPSVNNATFAPTDIPSSKPSEIASAIPSSQPIPKPSPLSSSIPSVVPSSVPSTIPSEGPSGVPSDVPSFIPSEVPSDTPSSNPSSQPSSNPSSQPSSVPSRVPSRTPSFVPTLSMKPSDAPSKIPSSSPSRNPTSSPSSRPSQSPTISSNPSFSPSSRPTQFPTISVRPTPCIWTAAERKQSKIGNGPNANCTGPDYLKNHVPVYIIDQSQDGADVTFRVNPKLFQSNISSLAAIQFDTSTSPAVCDVQSNVTFDHRRQFTGACTNGDLEVTFFLYMCGSETNVHQTNSTFCNTPNEIDDYYEYRYKLDCWEKCETEGPTSGPTSAPTDSLMPTKA